MSFAKSRCLDLTASSTEPDGRIVTRFLDVAWDDNIGTVKERLDEGVLVDCVNEFG